MIDTDFEAEVLEEALEDLPRIPGDNLSVLGLTELLLKDRACVEQLLRDEWQQAHLVPRFLGIALASFSLYGWTMAITLLAAPADAIPAVLAGRWSPGAQAMVALWLAYALGLVAAAGICLPSFYFYGLLAGIRISFLQVVAHTVKGLASTAVLLIGLLPIYVAIALGVLIFELPEQVQRTVLGFGLGLPFLAGLWGVASLYRGFMQLSGTLPAHCRNQRSCFLRSLTLAWAACYTTVTPFMINALWTQFAG